MRCEEALEIKVGRNFMRNEVKAKGIVHRANDEA